MTRVQFEGKCRAALFWAIVWVIVGEYLCRDAPFGAPAWVAAGLVLACLGVLFGRLFLATAFTPVSDTADGDRLGSALSRTGIVSIAGMALALALSSIARSDAFFNASIAAFELGFGLFVLWSEFWFRQAAGESAGTATRR